MTQLPPDGGRPAVEPIPIVNLVPGFALHVSTDGGQLVVRCTGVLDKEDAAAKVQPELMKIHESIEATRPREIRLELQEVSYMNSSGIKAFATWFLRAEGSREYPYVIDVVYDQKVSWQRWSVGALQTLTPRAIRLMTRSGDPLRPG